VTQGSADCTVALQGAIGVADWAVAADLEQLLPLFAPTAFPAVRAFAALVAASPAFTAGTAAMERVNAVLKPAALVVDCSKSVLATLSEVLTAAVRTAFPAFA
jgi:hypothetical protein